MKEFNELFDGMKWILSELKEIKSEIGELKMRDNAEIGPEYPINLRRASEILGLAPQTIYGKTSKGTIPHFKKGGKLYFMESELLRWLEGEEFNSI